MPKMSECENVPMRWNDANNIEIHDEMLTYSLSDKYFGRSLPALAWFCQTKVWTPIF